MTIAPHPLPHKTPLINRYQPNTIAQGMSQITPAQGRNGNPLQLVNRIITFVENCLLALSLFVMIALASTQIIMRNFWDSGLSWGDPSLSILVLWVGMLGAMVATREQNHINIDILSRFLPPRLKGVNQIVLDLFTAIISGLLAYHSYRFVVMEFEDGTVAFASVPAWLCEAIIPFGFGLIALRCGFTSLAQSIALIRKTPPSDGGDAQC